jgi:ubiquinone/menaquinone biosynthesis C-methylase UbiE
LNKWSKKRSVMRRYNLTAQMYDSRYCEEQEAKYKEALKTIVFEPNSYVLDVGCGTGMFFNFISEKVQSAMGIDVSRELLVLAKKRVSNLSNVSLIMADADNLPFKKEVFKYTFVFTVLQNMPNPANTLKQLQLSSTSDGNFIVTALKAAASLEKFGSILNRAGLRIVSLIDDETLQCYIVKAIQ